LRPAAIAVGFGSRFHVAIPERAPITLEDFDVSPKPRPPRDGLETSPLHIALRVRNATQKTIAAVAFRIQTHTRTGVLQAAFAVEGLNAFPNREIPVNADVQPVLSGGGSLELILDSVLFADLTSYGPDQAEALRLLTEDEAANRVERDYLSRLIANGQLDEVARELNAASVNPPPAANFELFEPAHPSVLPREVGTRTMHVPGVPLQIAAAGTAGGQLGVRLSNFSARTVSSVEVEVDGFDSTGDLVVAAHVPFIVRIPAGGTESIETGPGVGIRSQGPTGTVRSRVVFLRSVQFENGSWWTPEVHVGDAPSLGPAIQQTSTLVQILDRSPARLRLGALLRQSGMGAVEAELTRGNH
jgi:hypothetical protein